MPHRAIQTPKGPGKAYKGLTSANSPQTDEKRGSRHGQAFNFHAHYSTLVLTSGN